MNEHCLVCNKVDRAAKDQHSCPRTMCSRRCKCLTSLFLPVGLWWCNLLTALALIVSHGQLCASPFFFFFFLVRRRGGVLYVFFSRVYVMRMSTVL